MARQERERVETVRQAAESVSNVVRVSAEAPRRVAETAREAVQSGVGTAAQMAQKAADFGVSSFSDVTRGVQNAAASMTAVAQANTGLAMRYQAIWREVFQLAQQATQARTESMTRLMSVRSPQQLLDANVDLLKGEMQRFFEGQARLSQLSAEAALRCQAAHRGGDLRSEAGQRCCPGQGTAAPARGLTTLIRSALSTDHEGANLPTAAASHRLAAAQAHWRLPVIQSSRRRLEPLVLA